MSDAIKQTLTQLRDALEAEYEARLQTKRDYHEPQARLLIANALLKVLTDLDALSLTEEFPARLLTVAAALWRQSGGNEEALTALLASAPRTPA